MFEQDRARFRHELDEIRTAGLWKSERVITSPQGATITVNGKQVLCLCANNYLGLANDPALKAAAKAAIDSHGLGLASVRFICGTQDIHMTLEQKVSAFLGTEDTIVAYLIDAIMIGLMSFVPVAGWIAAIAYGLTRDSLPFLDGHSIDKKAMGLSAVTEDGQPLTNNWGPGIIRNSVLWIPLFPLVELIVLLTNQQGLRLGDQWAKTKVISVK